MGDRTKINRKPVSLNDIHYRLLQDLSAPPPPKPSSSGEEGNPSTNKPEGRRRLFKGSTTQTHHFVDNIDELHDDHIPDFDSFSEEKLSKVKIEGRRRLCKVSSRDKDNAGSGSIVPVQNNEPSFLGITDFDSPLPSKPITDGSNSNSCAAEIRDILNNLSSRLDLLSIDRKPGADKVNDSCSEFDVGGDREKRADMLEYASATSSFSGSPSDVNDVVTSGEYFVDKLHQTNNNIQGLTKGEQERVGGKLVTRGNSVVSNAEEVKDSNLGTEFECDNYVKRERKTESTLVKMKNESKSIVSIVEEEEDDRNLGIEFEGDNYVKKEKKTESTLVKIKNESKRVDERLGVGGKSCMSILRDEEDEDDSFSFSSKKEVEEGGRHAFKESSVIDLSDDSSDDSVLEEDGSITFSGSRSTYILPGQTAKMLYPHQRDGLKWLWSLHCQGKGGILGDDMGLGRQCRFVAF